MKYVYLCACAGGIFIVNFHGGGLDRFFCEAFCHERNDRRKIMQNAPFNEDDHCVLLSHVTHMDEWVMSHIWMNGSCHTYGWMSHVMHTDEWVGIQCDVHQCDVHQCDMHEVKYFNSFINMMCINVMCITSSIPTHSSMWCASMWCVWNQVFQLIHQCDVHQCNMHHIQYSNSFIYEYNVICPLQWIWPLHMNESCHMYRWMSHVACMDEWVMAHMSRSK